MNKKFSRKKLVIFLCFVLASGYLYKTFFYKTNVQTAPTKTNSILNVDSLKQQLTAAEQIGKTKNIDSEIKIYKDLLQDQRYFSFVHFNLGKAFSTKGNNKEAIHHFKKAIALHPKHVSAYTFLGIACKKEKEYNEAIQYLTKAVALHPTYFDANLHLSKAHYEQNQLDQALLYGRKAKEIQPKNIHALLNLAYTYNKRGELEKAVQFYQQTLAIDPKLANAHYNLGYTYKIQGQMEKARQSLDQAIELKPDYLDAHLARAQVKIASENIIDGWDEYEWRWGLFGIDPLQYKASMWDGSDIAGKTILLRTEQGLGDTMQFVRYAKEVKEKTGATVICKVQKPLVKLLSQCPYIDKVVAGKLDDSLRFDTHAQLMSLPRILKTTRTTIPNQMNYLYADPKLHAYWKEKLSHDKNFKVGLCWHVDPVHEKDKSPWSVRSISLKQLEPFTSIDGVSFYSLQKFRNYNPLMDAPEGLCLKTFGDDFDDKHGPFMDSAAIIANLDLVITVDTCIAHLAGALNKPVWMFLPYAPDCRWYLKQNKTPWYPTMKLYRQEKPKDWAHVITMVSNDLANVVQKNKTS